VGQRRGLGIPDKTPYYVIGIEPKQNRLIVGKEAELFADSFTFSKMNWTAGFPQKLPGTFMVKIRYRHQASVALVGEIEGGYSCKFFEKQRSITPGQFAVLYDGDELIGGGEISLG